MTGFVGGNGAGKTTTMRIILGVLDADAGEVRLDGETLRPGSRRRFGYMPEERGLYPKMNLEEQLVYLARLHGLEHARRPGRNAVALIERLGLRRARRRAHREASRSATSSARRSRRPSCTTPRCSCSTSRSRASTRWRSRRSSTCCASGPPRHPGAVLEPPTRHRRAALRRPRDHRRRTHPSVRPPRRPARASTRRCATARSADPTDSDLAREDRPVVTVVERTPRRRAVRRGRRRHGSGCPRRRSDARCGHRLQPPATDPRRDLQGGRSMSATRTARRSCSLVAAREIVMRLRSVAFLVSTGILLAIVLGSIVIGGLMAANPTDIRVAVVEGVELGDVPGIEAVPVDDRVEAEELVRSGDVEAAIVPSEHPAARHHDPRRPRRAVGPDLAAERLAAGRAARRQRAEPVPRLPRRDRVRRRLLRVGDDLRHDDRAVGRRREVDPGDRDPARRDPDSGAADRQDPRHLGARGRADRSHRAGRRSRTRR